MHAKKPDDMRYLYLYIHACQEMDPIKILTTFLLLVKVNVFISEIPK